MAEVGLLSYDYTPPTIGRFLASQAFVRGIRGPIGSGKSTTCCFEIMRRAFEQPPSPRDGVARTRWVIVRNTYPELRTTTMRTWHAIMPPERGTWKEQGPPSHLLRFGHEMGHGVEIEVIFLALDSPKDIAHVLSLELTGAWINEAREVPKAILDALTGRVGRFPAMIDGGPAWAGVMMDTNSPDSDHWWYILAEHDASTEAGAQLLASVADAEAELRARGILGASQPLFEFFAQPSGRAAEAENVPNLRPGYYQFALAGKSADWIKVYVDGEYGYVSEGRPVHPEYSDSLHCRPCAYTTGLDLMVGLDFGLTPAAAFTQMSARGQWRVLHELVATSMGVSRFAQVLARDIQQHYPGAKVKLWGDPAGNERDSEERTVFDILAAEGLIAWPAPSQDPSLRRDALKRPLMRLIDGEPGIIIDPSCTMIRKGLASKFQYRRIAIRGDARYEDKPLKNEYSHPCEALEYVLLGGGENAGVIKQGIPAAPIRIHSKWPVFGGQRR